MVDKKGEGVSPEHDFVEGDSAKPGSRRFLCFAPFPLSNGSAQGGA